jgi:hypothetical protein
MPVIRIVLLLSLVGGLTLFAFSNLLPVLPLVFLGVTTPAQPLATWIGGAFAAGAATSFFLQLLNSLVGGSSPRRVAQRTEVPPRSRPFARETPEPEADQSRYSPPPPETPTSRSEASDWEEGIDEDWDFDEESAASTSVNQETNRNYSRSTPQGDRTNYEAKQEPKSSSQTGSVYSYSYRDENDSGVGKADAVYDANYRVITPPYQKPVEPEDDEEDWGFEDDEEFDDDDRDTRRR